MKDPDLAEHEAEMAAWRDRIKIHPATDLFPMLSDEELSAISKNIDQNGLVTPLTFFCSMSITDEGCGRTDFGTVLDWANKNDIRRRVDVFLIDGRNRLAAIERIEDPARRGELLHDALAFDGHARLRFAEELRDPLGFVASANLHRRHLSAEQKRVPCREAASSRSRPI